MARAEKRAYGEEDFQEVIPTPVLNLSDIKATRCMSLKDGSPYLVFHCEPTKKYAHGCPVCGSIDYVSYGKASQPRIIHDVNIGIYQVMHNLWLTTPKVYHHLMRNK